MSRVTRIRSAVGYNQRTSCSPSAHFRLPCPPYPPLVSFPSSPLPLASLSRFPCSHCLALFPPLPFLESSTVRAVAGAGVDVDVHNPLRWPVRSATILLRSTFTSADTESPAFPTVHDSSPRVSNFSSIFPMSDITLLRRFSSYLPGLHIFNKISPDTLETGDSDGRLVYIIISSFPPPRNLRLFNFVYFSGLLNLFHT